MGASPLGSSAPLASPGGPRSLVQSRRHDPPKAVGASPQRGAPAAAAPTAVGRALPWDACLPSRQLPSGCWSGACDHPAWSGRAGRGDPTPFPHCPQRSDRLAGGQAAQTSLSSRARDQGPSVPSGRGAACSQGGRAGTLGGGGSVCYWGSPRLGVTCSWRECPTAVIRARMWLGGNSLHLGDGDRMWAWT